MNTNYELLQNCIKEIRKSTDFKPKTAIVLGSGLGGFSEKINAVKIINYSEIKDFPVSTNKMHKGRFILGYIGDIPIIAMDGRIHYYEGYSMNDVVLPIRLMKILGANNIILTNAAGGINTDFKPGNLMAITDHITSFVPSPLIGPNIDELGTRFPDMSHVYNDYIIKIMKTEADKLNIDLKTGVYLQTTGPNYETPSEIKAYATLGADAVGMSTACEAMTAIHCGMTVAGISCITNMASGITSKPLNDKEVGIIANSVSKDFSNLLYNTIININK